MKSYSLLILFILISILHPQEKYKTITDEKSGKQMLVGEITREAFKDTCYSWWFNSEYEMYKPGKVQLDSITLKLKNVHIIIILGTWCSDSRREVPRFIKILDSLNFPINNLRLIAINRDKKDLSGEIDSLSIDLVPTFIFYNDKKELGRIIEAPKETLEKDFKTILWRNYD